MSATLGRAPPSARAASLASASSSLDTMIAAHRPNVLLALFGFDESFAGPAGVARFEADHLRVMEVEQREAVHAQAFDALRTRGWKVARTDRTFATVDHIVPTRDRQRPFLDVLAEDMISALERNCDGSSDVAFSRL